MKTLKNVGELNSDISKLRVEVILDKNLKTLTIRDNGIGMTIKELDKYINQIALPGEEFVNKYKDADKGTQYRSFWFRVLLHIVW